MRLLLVAALFAAAFAARDSTRWNFDKLVTEKGFKSGFEGGVFKTGMEYRFHLDSQVSNGLAVPGSEQAAVRMQSLVALNFPGEEMLAHLRIEHVRMASLQKEIDEPKKIQPFEIFDEIEINEENLRKLRLPLRFRYENGLVSEIEFDREDAEWSKNIKRTYLNMLQVNLSRKNLVKESVDFYSGKESTFTASEMTLEGECEVTYTVVPETSEDSEEPELRVTKSINLQKCTRRVGQKALLAIGEKEATRFNGEEREIESTTVFDYKIFGTHKNFLINEVELRSVYAYSPLSDVNSLFNTFVSGKLRLVEVTKENKRIAAPKSEKKESLLHSMEWEKKEQKFLATGDESLLKESPFPEMKNKHEVVARLVKSLVKHMESEEHGIDLAATHEMGRIVRVLRWSTKEDIKKMHKEICMEEDSQMKLVFTDALALAGSYNTVEHLIEKIRAREVSPVRAAALLKQLSSVPVPSEKIIHSLISLCKDSKHMPVERQSCWLSVGALMNGLCGDQTDLLEAERACPRDLKEKFVRELTQQFENAETRYEKVLALKSISNSGMDLIVFPLEKIIKDKNEEQIIRIQAIEALRKLNTVMHHKLISILMPVYKNTKEHLEVRLAAFRHIMMTVPEKHVIDMIINQLETEPFTQVQSFVYGALVQFSESQLPHEKRAAEYIKTALKSTHVRPSRKMSSTFKYFTTYNEENNSGAALNWAAVFGTDSALPKELRSTVKTSVAGKMASHQIGYYQHNLEKKLYKLLEKVDRSMIEDVLIRGKRSADFKPTELLRNLFSDLKIAVRQQNEENANAIAYVRINDMDFALLPIDEETVLEVLKSVSRNGKFDHRELESLLVKGIRFNTVLSSVVYDHSRTIVHSMGMPLTFSAQLPAIFRIDGEIKPELAKGALRMRVQARPSIAATHVLKVEIMNPLVNLGVKILHSAQANLPVDITSELTYKEKLVIKHTFVLPKESRRLFQIQTRPVSFVRVWPKESRAYIQPKERTMYVEQLESLVHKIEESYLEKATGIKLNVDGHYHGHIFEQGVEELPHALLIGENNLEVRFEKTEQTPKEYVWRTEIDLFNEESRLESPKMERFLDKEEHFETEKYESYEETERTRRGEFEGYVNGYKTERGYSHRLFSEIKSVGARKEHKAQVELMTVCDEKMRHCKINLKGMNTPLLEKETRDYTFETEIEMLYPKMPKTLQELMAQKHREVSINVESRWGSDYKNEMTMKIQGEQNKEQKKWMKLMSEMRDEDVTPMEEYYRLLEASMLNQYKTVIKYDIKCPVSRGLINRLFTMIKAGSPMLSTSFEYGHNEKNVVRAQLTLEPLTCKYANISIHTPSEKVVIRDLRVESSLPRLNIRREPTTPIRSLLEAGSALVDETKVVCTVESRKIRSFDDVIYRTPLTTCYSVLAKDCSSKQPDFAVLMKKIAKNGEEKKMKIITKESVIELEMDKRSEKVLVTVDGEEVERVEKLEKAGIYKKGEIIVVDLDDVSVMFDGYTADIKLSEYYKNKQCGLCGHFDGEKKTEFRRADNEETEDMEEFHRSFLVKDRECKVEEEKLSEKRNYRIESEESSSEEESIFETKWDKKSKKNVDEDDSETVEPKEKTRVIEYSQRVCFSLKPVPECPKKAVTDEEKKMKVAFTCMPRSDSETQRLMREARREILDLELFDVTLTETLNVPRTCVVY